MTVVIFDLDGTLIDSAPDIHAVANAVLALEGLPPLPLATVRGFVGRGVPHLVRRLLEASGKLPESADLDRVGEAFLERYEGAVTLTRSYPGVPQALEALQAAGHRLALCTNKPEAPTRAVLAHLGLAFPVIVGGDRLAVKKPDPAPLLLALAESGGGAALYVGDSEVDAETAAAAGLPFLLFTEGYRKAPVSALPHAAAFDDFAGLPGLVAGLTR